MFLGPLTALFLAVLATYTDFPTGRVFLERMAGNLENVLALRRALAEGARPFHTFAMNLLLSKVILPLWCARPRDTKLVQFPHRPENVSLLLDSSSMAVAADGLQQSCELPRRREYYCPFGHAHLLKYASFFMEPDHIVRYLLDAKPCAEAYLPGRPYPDPIVCLLRWTAAGPPDDYVGTTKGSPLGCLCSTCSDSHLFANTVALVCAAADGGQRPLPLTCVVRHLEATHAGEGRAGSGPQTLMSTGAANHVPPDWFGKLLHHGMAATRLAPAAGIRRKTGMVFRKTAPLKIDADHVVVCCQRDRASGRQPMCDGCLHVLGDGRGPRHYIVFSDLDLLKDALLLLGLGSRQALPLLQAPSGRPPDLSWAGMTRRWLGAQKRLDSFSWPNVGRSKPPDTDPRVLRVRARRREYRFNLVNKNRVLTFPMWLPYPGWYRSVVSVHSNNLCSSFVKEVLAFRSSLDPCTFSRYRCPEARGGSGQLVFNANVSGERYYQTLHSLSMCLDRLTRASCPLGALPTGPVLLNDSRTSNSCYTLDLHGILNQSSYRQRYRKLFNDSSLLYGKRAKPVPSFPAFRVTHRVASTLPAHQHTSLDVQYHKGTINISKLHGPPLKSMMLTDLTNLLNCRHSDGGHVCRLSARLNELKWREEHAAGHLLTAVHQFFTELCFYYGCEWLVGQCVFSRDNYAHAGAFCCDKTAGATALAEEGQVNCAPKAWLDPDLLSRVRVALPHCDLGPYGKFSGGSLVQWSQPGRSAGVLACLLFPPSGERAQRGLPALLDRIRRRLNGRDVDGLRLFYEACRTQSSR